MKLKYDLIRELKKVKLIIGNGFDLHCNLKTSYRDYFLHSEGKNEYFLNWIDHFKRNVKYYLNESVSNHKELWPEFKKF